MTDVQVPDGKISRRRVVQGVMWSAPAVMIATALPAAAASTGNGTMSFASGATLARTGTNPRHYVFANIVLQHTDGSPITNLTVTITSNVNELTTPAVTGSGWSLGSGDGSTFVFIYSGSISAGSATPALGVEFTRANAGASIATFTVTGTGNTNGGTGNATAAIPPPLDAA